MGEGGRRLVVEAFSSSGVGYIGPDPFFYSLPCLPGRIRPTPAVKSSLNCCL
jgi:hypothetical protein